MHKKGIFDTAVLRLPHDATLTVPEEVFEKLKYTALVRNLAHNVYSTGLNELWLHLTREEIELFFSSVLDQAGMVEIDIVNERVGYRKPDFMN